MSEIDPLLAFQGVVMWLMLALTLAVTLSGVVSLLVGLEILAPQLRAAEHPLPVLKEDWGDTIEDDDNGAAPRLSVGFGFTLLGFLVFWGGMAMGYFLAWPEYREARAIAEAERLATPPLQSETTATPALEPAPSEPEQPAEVLPTTPPALPPSVIHQKPAESPMPAPASPPSVPKATTAKASPSTPPGPGPIPAERPERTRIVKAPAPEKKPDLPKKVAAARSPQPETLTPATPPPVAKAKPREVPVYDVTDVWRSISTYAGRRIRVKGLATARFAGTRYVVTFQNTNRLAIAICSIDEARAGALTQEDKRDTMMKRLVVEGSVKETGGGRFLLNDATVIEVMDP